MLPQHSRAVAACLCLSIFAYPTHARDTDKPVENSAELYPYCEPYKGPPDEKRAQFDMNHLTLTANSCGFIDRTGKFVIDKKFWWIGVFHDGLAPAIDASGLLGFIDVTGRYVIPPRFSTPERINTPAFLDGVALAVDESGSGMGAIDTKGNWIIQPKKKPLLALGQGLVAEIAKKNETLAIKLYDTTGKLIRPEEFEGFVSPAQDRIFVKLDGKYGLIDIKGNWILEPSPALTEAKSFSEGLAAVKVGDLWGYLDTNGQFAIEPQFGSAEPFYEGAATVSPKGSYFHRFIDKSGVYINDVVFTQNARYGEGLAAISPQVDPKRPFMNGPWHYVDKSGKPAFDWTADYALSFKLGFAVVSPDENSAGVIDKTGQWRLKPMQGINTLSIKILPGPIFQVRPIKYDQPTWLYFDTDGQPIVPH